MTESTLKVFVAGGTGVLGRRVVPALRAAGHQVTVNVRNEKAQRLVTEWGADAVTIDLFDEGSVRAAVDDHDVVVHVATSIPTGARAIRPKSWSANDRLRTEASGNLASAAIEHGCSYVGESITFPYEDCGDEWIDEDVPRTFFAGNRSVIDAERAAQRVADAGGNGVSLRFGMFVAEDSAHTTEFRAAARRGLLFLPGAADGYTSFIDIDDAARAVVAGIDAPSGIYNVAEPEPSRRREHAAALSLVLGRKVRCGPSFATRFAGAAVASLGRSQRVASHRLSDATGWEPRIDVRANW